MRARALVWLILWFWPLILSAQGTPLQYNTYGAPGLIDMPTAGSAPDAELAYGLSHFADQTRNTLTFQATPRLSVSFRYAALNDIRGQQDIHYDRILDRSLALHYRFLDETARRPAMAVGVADFVGTGIYSGEYIVASKALRPDLTGTLGIGWGRFAGTGGFSNPLGGAFADRPERDFAEGGQVTRNAFFRGDAAFFGGLHWQPNPRWGLMLEYSSDVYPYEDGSAFDRRSPVNLGLRYTPRPGLQLGANYLYGAELGVQLSYAINPTRPPHGSGYGVGPAPIRSQRQGMLAEGLTATAQDRQGSQLVVALRNSRYPNSAQALGRAARVLDRTAPKEIGSFALSLEDSGLRGPALILDRATLAGAEFALAGSDILRDTAQWADPVDAPSTQTSFDWQIRPYVTPNIFDPDDPLRADFGLALDGRLEWSGGLVAAGTIKQRIAGNLDQTTRRSTSVLPHVRSDFALYEQEGDADIADLTLSWYGQPHADVTTRLSAGLFETMYGGASAEILWRPGGGDLAFGAEINRLRQRDYDGGFDFLDYDVTSGHGSVYWRSDADYHVQLDAGRYLAGDWGATLTLSRQFRNGWSLGAFATLTDVPFEEFGEGSFDKGFVISVPLSWVSGRPRRDVLATTIRPVTRDGGARVQIDDRLYPLTAPLTRRAITDSWGAFWR